MNDAILKCSEMNKMKFRRDLKATSLTGVFSLVSPIGVANPVLIENTPAARERNYLRN
jgi:hypothetical protein